MTGPVARVREGTVALDAPTALEVGRRRRLGAFLALVLGLSALLALLWPTRGPVAGTGWTRTTLHVTADSFVAVHALAKRLGYRESRLRASYAALPPPSITALVCLDPMPHARLRDAYGGAETGQAKVLAAWVQAGGSLLVTWPGQWLEPGAEPVAPPPPDREDLIGAVMTVVPDVRWVPARGNLVGAGPLREVRQPWPRVDAAATELAAAFVQPPTDPETEPKVQAFATPLPPEYRPLLALDGAPLVIERQVGNGRVLAASTPLLFSNVGLAHWQCGHAAAVLMHTAADGGRRSLLFDEFAHGQREARGAWFFVAHGPLGHAVAASLLVLLVIAWRGMVRLGPPTAEAAVGRRAKEEFVLAVADLAERAGHARAAGQALLHSYERDARERDGKLAAALARLHQRLDSGQPFCDKELVALAASIDGIVSEQTR